MTNIGFGPDAAHYTTEVHGHSMLPTSPMRFPVRHPKEVRVSESADLHEWKLLHPVSYPRVFGDAPAYLRRRLARIAASLST